MSQCLVLQVYGCTFKVLVGSVVVILYCMDSCLLVDMFFLFADDYNYIDKPV